PRATAPRRWCSALAPVNTRWPPPDRNDFPVREGPMQRSTAILLILLRLTIGWHFLYEGLQKVHSHHVGETTSSRPFSSGGYFREAPGPLGAAYRYGVGDADDEALGKLTPLPVPEGTAD